MGWYDRGMKRQDKQLMDQITADSSAYQKALEKAAYSDAGSQYSQGIGDISRYLAGAGPLADSGAGTALRSKLASSIYGNANRQILGGYSNYLGTALQGRRNFLYQLALMRAQRKMQGSGPGSFLARIPGAIGGFLAAGPPGAAAGFLGGGGGYPGSYQAQDYPYYG